MDRLRWLPFLIVSAILANAIDGQAIDRSKLMDLTYSFNDTTVYWPNAPGFRHQKAGWNVTPRGYWYAAGEFASAEHGGTHLDSPVHFAQGMATLDRIPVQKLVAAAVVVDVTAGAAKNRLPRNVAGSARLGKRKTARFRRIHRCIPHGLG